MTQENMLSDRPVESRSTPVFNSPKAQGALERKPDTARRVNSLDGVRTIAVLAVMMVHTGFPGATLGFLGVDIFFVMSGFLITTLLCNESRRNGNINLPKFWARRFLRLMPAYWMYVGTLTIWMLLQPETLSAHSGWSPRSYIGALWGYFVNYVPQHGIWTHQYFTIHLWSLAVEEQFYFLWPFVAYFAFRLRRPWLIGWLAVAAIVVRRAFSQPTEMWGTLSTRGIGIVLGCAVAMTLASGIRPRWLGSVKLRNLVVLLIGVVIAALTIANLRGVLSEDDVKSKYIGGLGAMFVVAIAMLWYGPPDWLTRILSSRIMVYFGQISYGLYLFHVPAQMITWKVLTPGLEIWNKYPKFGIRFTIYVCLTVLMASVSYYAVERRFLALKNRIR